MGEEQDVPIKIMHLTRMSTMLWRNTDETPDAYCRCIKVYFNIEDVHHDHLQTKSWEEKSSTMLKQWSRYGSGCYEYECSGGLVNVVIRNVSFPCSRAGVTACDLILLITDHPDARPGDPCGADREEHGGRGLAAHRGCPVSPV